MRKSAAAALFLGLIPSHANAEPAAAPDSAARVIGQSTRDANYYNSVCQTLQSAAMRNDLPVAFLTRLIWQESRFDANAVSPAGARGVAQFMPATAAWFGLANPFDVSEAIKKSAEFLRSLNKQFGNLGLAAAGYNAGPKRVQDWLAGSGGLPAETAAYVQIITGHTANEWRLATSDQWDLMLPEDIPCPQLVKLLAGAPERISPQRKPASPAAAPVEPVWALQLIGDPSQSVALARYHELQKTYKSILGGVQPLVLAYKAGRNVSWYQIRVAASSYFQAQRLCSGLRAAGRSCLVQATDGRLLSLKKEGS
jgi:Transglycosylase SLT domain